MSPTARTLQALRRDGFTAQVVERWIPDRSITVDLFGCIDLAAVKAGEPVLAVQATSGSNHAARVGKSRAEPRLRTWLKTGSRFEVWSWAKVDGKWECRRTPLILDELAGVATIDPPRRRRKRKDRQLSLF